MKALVLNSGGVDSTTCVALAVHLYGKENVITASLYYGQKHDKELKCARDIAEIIELATGSKDVLVVVEGEHSCMTARGIKSRGSKTRTATIRGQFESNYELRKETYSLMSLD